VGHQRFTSVQTKPEVLAAALGTDDPRINQSRRKVVRAVEMSPGGSRMEDLYGTNPSIGEPRICASADYFDLW